MRTKPTLTLWKLASFILITLLGFSGIGAAQEGEGTWTQGLAPMPTARRFFSASVVNGKIYAIGGWDGEPISTVEVYDPATDRWMQKANMLTPRWGPSTSVVNGKIYAIGGDENPSGNGNSPSPMVEEYDPLTDTWTAKTDMPTPRWLLSTSVVEGKIYAIGGSIRGGNPNLTVSTVEEYNPLTDTWTLKTPMPTRRNSFSTSVVNGDIYTISGYDGASAIDPVEVYNPKTDTWTRKNVAPTPRGNLPLHAPVVNGKIHVIGGWDGEPLSTVEVYDPATDRWMQKANMPTPRFGLSTSVVNGEIYAIGGWVVGDVSNVEVYDTGVGVRVTTISPDFGQISGGEPITISGRNFPLDAVVTIGGNPLAEPEVNENQITGVTPAGERGKHDILITAPSIDFTVSEGTFFYTRPVDVVVMGMTPTTGVQRGGETGSIMGIGFQEGPTVTVGGVSATDVIVVDETHITFRIPPGAAGTVDVIVTNLNRQEWVLRDGYTYRPFPAIERIDPSDGPVEGGTSIDIIGSNFIRGVVVTIGELQVKQVDFLIPTRLRLETLPGHLDRNPCVWSTPTGKTRLLKKDLPTS